MCGRAAEAEYFLVGDKVKAGIAICPPTSMRSNCHFGDVLCCDLKPMLCALFSFSSAEYCRDPVSSHHDSFNCGSATSSKFYVWSLLLWALDLRKKPLLCDLQCRQVLLSIWELHCATAGSRFCNDVDFSGNSTHGRKFLLYPVAKCMKANIIKSLYHLKLLHKTTVMISP